jgi:hypothetical protein
MKAPCTESVDVSPLCTLAAPPFTLSIQVENLLVTDVEYGCALLAQLLGVTCGQHLAVTG